MSTISRAKARKVRSKKQPLVLDLFAGAGGLSEGFIRAGFDVAGHVEMDKQAASTIVTRMIYHALKERGLEDVYAAYVKGDITRDEIIEKYELQDIKDSVIAEKIDETTYKNIIERLHRIVGDRRVDIIVGGPPCQAYSYIGRARDLERMHGDERNFLYKYYVEFLKAFKPKMFVFENVPGLLTAGKGKYLSDMRDLMREVGYTTDLQIVNAADFGVPQNRKRVILIGWSDDSKLTAYPTFPVLERDYTVGDFLNDLPKLKAGEGSSLREFKSDSALLQDLDISNASLGILMDHVARPNNARDLEIYEHAVKLKNKGEILKYNMLPSHLKTHKNETGFLDRFKVVDSKGRGSHTVVAHISKDGHFYIHPDIQQNRSLTVREAARLQTFPDDFYFEGSRGAKYKQIGNAVPPMMAKALAMELHKYL